MSLDQNKLPLTDSQRAELIKRARSENYHFGGCNEDERTKDYCNCADEFVSDLADALEGAEQPEGRSYDRCAHIGSPYAAGTRANMPCRIPRKDHLEAGDETGSGYLFDHDFVGPTEQAFDAKQIGDELHDILADSMLECNCDENGKCTACKIDDLAHRLSPFPPDVIAAGLVAEEGARE